MFWRGNSWGSGCCYETGYNRLTAQHALAKVEMFLARVMLSLVTFTLQYFLLVKKKVVNRLIVPTSSKLQRCSDAVWSDLYTSGKTHTNVAQCKLRLRALSSSRAGNTKIKYVLNVINLNIWQKKVQRLVVKICKCQIRPEASSPDLCSRTNIRLSNIRCLNEAPWWLQIKIIYSPKWNWTGH